MTKIKAGHVQSATFMMNTMSIDALHTECGYQINAESATADTMQKKHVGNKEILEALHQTGTQKTTKPVQQGISRKF